MPTVSTPWTNESAWCSYDQTASSGETCVSLMSCKVLRFNEQTQAKIDVLLGFGPRKWKWLTVGIRNMTTVHKKSNSLWLWLYLRCVLCNYELQSLKGKWLECVPPPNVYDKCDGTKCPPGRDVISRMTWLVKKEKKKKNSLQKVGRLFCWRGKWADRCCCHQISMSYEGVCSCNEATSAALLRNSMLWKWTYVFPWEKIS